MTTPELLNHTVEYERIVCPYCESNDHGLFIEGKELDTFRFYRRWAGFERLNYVICRECRLIFANPRLRYTDTTLNDLIPEHVTLRHRNNPPTEPGRQKKPRKKVANIVSLLGPTRGRFLEIGCGSGNALMAATTEGFEAIGTELYRDFVEYGRNRGLDVRPGSVDTIPFDADTFDVVYLEDVLEHLKNPFSYLDEAARVLRRGGVLFIHTWTVTEPIDVVSAFGDAWRSDHNLDLTAHTTLFPLDLLKDYVASREFELCRSDLVRYSGGRPPRGPELPVQTWDFYYRKAA